MGIAHGIDGSAFLTLEPMIMAGLIVFSVTGIIVAWWKERVGGVILLASAVAHSTFAYIVAGHNKEFAVMISGGPFLVVGVLVMISWYRSRMVENLRGKYVAQMH